MVFVLSKDVVLYKTKLGKFYRTTVSENVRGLLKVGIGDLIEWIFNDGRVYVRKTHDKVCVNG
jgi:hypothetical protein